MATLLRMSKKKSIGQFNVKNSNDSYDKKSLRKCAWIYQGTPKENVSMVAATSPLIEKNMSNATYLY